MIKSHECAGAMDQFNLVDQSLHAFVVRVDSTQYYVLGKYDLTQSVMG